MKKYLKIGIICYPTVGGSGVVATNLGNKLARLGHQVHFMSYETPFLLNLKARNIFFHQVGINEYTLFKYPDYTLPLAETIITVHQKYHLDILHVHYAVPHATAALLARRILLAAGKKPPRIITTLHGTDITLLASDPNLFTVIKYSIEKSDGVTAVSRDLKKDTLRVLKTKKPIEVIYNFFSPPSPTRSSKMVRQGLRIYPVKSREAGAAKQLFNGVKDNDFLAIHLSNLRPVKRIPDLLKIAAALKSDKRFKLLILAGETFAPYQPLAKKYKLKNLILKTHVKDIENYLNAADMGIYTSETESFGMGMLETMAYDNPVLATRAGGVPEVMQDGKTGFLLKVGDIKGFVSKIKLLLHNKTLTLKLGAQAKQRAATAFSAEKIVRKYIDYYRKILNKRSC